MSDAGRPPPVLGGLFRHNYLRPSTPLADSMRARRRLLQSMVKSRLWQERFVALVQSEIGVEYPAQYAGWDHAAFWERADIGDVLSAITLWHRVSQLKDHYRSEVIRIFSEEHLRYRLDANGGVHFLVDEEFERVVASTVAGLGATRFAASLHALHEAMSNLGTAKQSGKGLIRGVFEAVESAFLVVIAHPSVDRLNATAIDKHLKPLLMAGYPGYAEANDMVERLLEHFKAWVKSAHPFRHGAPLEQIHEAPLDLAILSATQGMGYLRYLAGTPGP